MMKFAGEKPVVFEILLIIASFLLSLVFMLPFQAMLIAEAAYAFYLVTMSKADTN